MKFPRVFTNTLLFRTKTLVIPSKKLQAKEVVYSIINIYIGFSYPLNKQATNMKKTNRK